jgi:hypothetical protein
VHCEVLSKIEGASNARLEKEAKFCSRRYYQIKGDELNVTGSMHEKE